MLEKSSNQIQTSKKFLKPYPSATSVKMSGDVNIKICLFCHARIEETYLKFHARVSNTTMTNGVIVIGSCYQHPTNPLTVREGQLDMSLSGEKILFVVSFQSTGNSFSAPSSELFLKCFRQHISLRRMKA